jgi:glycosyltransferase involved in cell wall biosynthesis
MRILMVTSRFPLPPWRGNQVRTVQWIEALSDHLIMLVCPTGEAVFPLELGVELRLLPGGRLRTAAGLLLAAAVGRPAQEGVYASIAGRRIVRAALEDWRPDVAVIQMVRCGWAIDAIHHAHPGLPVLFDAIDSMALHYRRAVSSAAPWLRPAMILEAERCRRREVELVSRAGMTTAVSSRDLDALKPGDRGRVVPVAAGVEVDACRRPAGSPTVLMSGNLGYRPTVEAALWFAREVWPRLRGRNPSARWVLAGARPARSVRRLSTTTGVEIHADVDDLGDYLMEAHVAVAPMASGSGVPIKILEAIAAGVPVVADGWSAAGLADPGAVAVAEGAAGWVETIDRLLGDADFARAQAARAAEVWRTHYHPRRVATAIRSAVDAVAAGGPR